MNCVSARAEQKKNMRGKIERDHKVESGKMEEEKMAGTECQRWHNDETKQIKKFRTQRKTMFFTYSYSL